MRLARSILFNILFYAAFLAMMAGISPLHLFPRLWTMRVAKAWARFSCMLMRSVLGLDCEFRGVERIPQGSLLVAAKHQSMWETFALMMFFRDPAFILKRELMFIPVFGWWMARLRMIPVNRGARSAALAAMAERAKIEIAQERQILIFPEGTRRPPGAPPAYKFGTAFLYGELGVQCLPVALNSGLFWPRRMMRKHPGTIVMEFLEPIAPGLDREVFAKLLQERIETASDRLLLEAAEAPAPPPLPPSAEARLAGLRPAVGV